MFSGKLATRRKFHVDHNDKLAKFSFPVRTQIARPWPITRIIGSWRQPRVPVTELPAVVRLPDFVVIVPFFEATVFFFFSGKLNILRKLPKLQTSRCRLHRTWGLASEKLCHATFPLFRFLSYLTLSHLRSSSLVLHSRVSSERTCQSNSVSQESHNFSASFVKDPRRRRRFRRRWDKQSRRADDQLGEHPQLHGAHAHDRVPRFSNSLLSSVVSAALQRERSRL